MKSFRNKYWLRAGLVIVAIVGSIIAVQMTTPKVKIDEPVTVNKLKVVASFYPIAEFARQIGGDLVEVETITPVGTEPHDYEPTPQQMSDIYEADVFLYNGAGLDSWAEKIGSVGALSSVIDLKTSDEGLDPHFWLNPELAIKEVNEISLEIARVDEPNREVYLKNAADYILKLESLANEYETGLATCSQRTVLTSHAAFAYLASEYDFSTIALAGLSPEEEPSAGRLAEIAQMAKNENIKYIYFETLVSPKLAQTIADEVGAQTLVFNPLEGLTAEEMAAGEDYISVMQTNLHNLRTGMLCE